MSRGIVHHFGPFRLDEQACRVFRGDAPLELSPRLVDLLRLLVSRPGALRDKNELIDALWPGVFVTENSLTRAISDLRHALGDSAASPQYIQTIARRGYRFVGAVETGDRDASRGRDEAGDPLAAYRDWAEGRLLLESLSRAALPQAIASFERARVAAPTDPLVHVALANAYFLDFETTRARNDPERPRLQRAVAEAREACRLGPHVGETWATLGFVLTSTGDGVEARAAARRAVDLEPGNWRHLFRLAYATWGEERLRAVDRALALYPAFPYGLFLAAMVHTARGALDAAEATLRRGAEMQDAQEDRPAVLPAVGLHWLLGLVCAARGRAVEARSELERELAFEGSGTIYATEFAVNACAARGALLLGGGDAEGAVAAFRAALGRLPGQARAHLGLAIALARLGEEEEAAEERAATDDAIAQLRASGRVAEAALVEAGRMAMSGARADAIRALESLLLSAPPGFAGWTTPVEPFLRALDDAPGFARVKTILAERAA